MTAFVEDLCVIDPVHEIDVADLYAGELKVDRWGDEIRTGGFRGWCREQGIEHIPTSQRFGAQLHAACPSVKTGQRRGSDGGRVRVYRGITLLARVGTGWHACSASIAHEEKEDPEGPEASKTNNGRPSVPTRASGDEQPDLGYTRSPNGDGQPPARCVDCGGELIYRTVGRVRCFRCHVGST